MWLFKSVFQIMKKNLQLILYIAQDSDKPALYSIIPALSNSTSRE